MVRGPDGELRFCRPDGQLLPDAPRPPRIFGDPVSSLRAGNQAEGLVLDARTSMPLWSGERLDVGYAIDVLHPLANGNERADLRDPDGDDQSGFACVR